MRFAIVITVAALAFSILVSSLFVRLTHSKDEFQRGVIISIVLTILVSVSLLRYEASQLMAPIAATASALSDEQVSSTLVKYRKSMDSAGANSNTVMREALRLSFKKFRETVDEFSRTASLEVDLEDLGVMSLRMIDSAKHSIKAINYVDSQDFWTTPWGKPYFSMNKKKISEGVRIERVFVFDDQEEMRKNLNLLACNAEIGVKVSVLLLSELSHPIGQDVVIIDDYTIAMLVRFGPSKHLEASIFSTDPEFIKDRITNYDTAALNAQLFVVPQGTTCTGFNH